MISKRIQIFGFNMHFSAHGNMSRDIKSEILHLALVQMIIQYYSMFSHVKSAIL
jgi:hypothetical protein